MSPVTKEARDPVRHRRVVTGPKSCQSHFSTCNHLAGVVVGIGPLGNAAQAISCALRRMDTCWVDTRFGTHNSSLAVQHREHQSATPRCLYSCRRKSLGCAVTRGTKTGRSMLTRCASEPYEGLGGASNSSKLLYIDRTGLVASHKEG